MNNEERILQMLTGMQQDISGMKQDMVEVKKDISGLKQQMSSFEDRLDEHKAEIKLEIENNIGKRLDSLVDGYLLNREKHDILEDRVGTVEVRVDRLEVAAG